MDFKRAKNDWLLTFYSCRFLWQDFNSILRILIRKDELRRLIRWAHRKKLRSVGEHYQWLFSDTESRFSSQALRHPHLTELAKWIYCAAIMINPPPDVYPKGSAAKYRLRN